MDVSEAKRLKALENENGRLKKLLADAMLDNSGSERPARKNGDACHEAASVAHLVQGHWMSERRACRVIGCCRMTMRYEVVRQDDSVLRERLNELAKVRRRFGYRRRMCFCGVRVMR